MSISTFFGLQTALSGLNADQQALDVAGHNIANVSTPGYSRQTAVLEPSPAFTYANGGGGVQIGSGVDVQSIQRARDSFLDLQYRAQAMQLGDASQRAESLGQAQTALAEPSDDGLAARLQSFWSAWGDLSNDPTSTAARQALLDSATDVADGIQTLDGRLATVQQQAGQQSAQLLAADGPVHADAVQLSKLNDAIAGATAAGQTPNDLLDQRDQLLDQLSSLAQVSVVPSTTRPGAVSVLFGDVSSTATPLVDGDVPGAAAVATWPPSLGGAPGGQLGALASLASTTSGPLADLRGQLKGVAAALVSTVNDAYTVGGTVSGGFFSATAGDEAGHDRRRPVGDHRQPARRHGRSRLQRRRAGHGRAARRARRRRRPVRRVRLAHGQRRRGRAA